LRTACDGLKGRVVLSTDATQVGKSYDKQGFFAKGLKGSYVQPPFYSTSLGRMSVIAAQPGRGRAGTGGGRAGRPANITRLSQIMTQRTGLGETGETIWLARTPALLTEVRSGENIGYVHTRDYRRDRKPGNGFGDLRNYQGVPCWAFITGCRNSRLR